MEPVLGDVYDIASRVRAFDPTYSLKWNPILRRYQVYSTKRKLREEGVLNGCPLFVMRDVEELVFTWEVEGMAPDMRILWHLHETDIWNYRGGPEAFYDDLMRESEATKRKREEAVNDYVEYTAKERAPFIARSVDGMDMKKYHSVPEVV